MVLEIGVLWLEFEAFFPPNFAPFFAAVAKSEPGPPEQRCGSRTAHTLAGTCLQIQEIRHSGGRPSQKALWLANGPYFGRK